MKQSSPSASPLPTGTAQGCEVRLTRSRAGAPFAFCVLLGFLAHRVLPSRGCHRRTFAAPNPLSLCFADFDECTVYGTCSQTCTNTEGSYTCSCVEGYLLQPDNRSCKAKNGESLGEAAGSWWGCGSGPLTAFSCPYCRVLLSQPRFSALLPQSPWIAPPCCSLPTPRTSWPRT